MPALVPSASFFRKGSARLLLCVGLLCTMLLVATLHLLSALSVLVAIAAVGAFRRSQELGSRGRAKSAGAAGNHASAESFPAHHRGVADRQALEAKLEAQWTADQDSDEPTSLLLVRPDSMESLDKLQQKGDVKPSEIAMLTLASALSRMLPREADMLARYDEATFAVVLCGTDLPGSLRVAARLRWAIVRLGIANPSTTSGFLTACMGVAVHHGPATGKTAALMAAAEKMLGVAQRIGEDSLEYVVSGVEPRAGATETRLSATARSIPAIRAWTPERSAALHSPQA